MSETDEVDGAVASRLIHASSNIRSIRINGTQDQHYLSNKISTAKYSFLSFVPKFLYEQFRRLANVFFLSIGLLQQIPNVSPTGRFVTIVPFSVILALTALKELVEDYKRHRADDKTNNSLVEVLADGGNWQKKPWKDLKVGDVVRVVNGQFFPSDLVLLASCEPMGMCNIETSNLDGETNLKIRSALLLTCVYDTQVKISELQGEIRCELPNKSLYEFQGNISISRSSDDWTPLNPNSILLRGAKLMNTDWIHGVVIYTGHETKLLMNSTKAPLKRSRIDCVTNSQIILLFFILVAIAIVSALGNWILTECFDDNHQIYWGPFEGNNFFYNVLTFFILYNNLIPISLQVTLEFVRFIQAFFINWDEGMFHKPSNTYALARTSNLNEELGQIKYVFSDKTGTLTENIMEFKRASIAGVSYSISADEEQSDLIRHLREKSKSKAIIEDFLVLMAMCHTVIPDTKDDGVIHYNASSPDEKALVEGAARYGYHFVDRKPDTVVLKTPNGMEEYTILNIIEFTSDRKRMTVIARTPSNEIKLFVKGADTMVSERLANDPVSRKFFDQTLDHCVEYAVEGLRTLFLAVRSVSEEEYHEWQLKYRDASMDLFDREKAIAEAAEDIEKELTLLGATAIEDKLQEGVPEAIADLLEANIKVWLLTGDKQETAINIGHSCRLLKGDTPIITLNDERSIRQDISNHVEEFRNNCSLGNNDNNVSLVIDGKTLGHVLRDDPLKRTFFDLCNSCSSVICCRVSPSQKAEVVDLVTKFTGEVSLAIGDGANDVAMIQKANVGVGISGNEGLQAANSSDFAIAQFRFITRLLFVHGSWNYTRVSKVILYSFYKNICLYVIELWYALYNYWSGQVLFERWTIGMYNIFFTSMPPIAMGIFDHQCTAETRLSHPVMYQSTQLSEYFNIKIFWFWVLKSLIHSVILYWLPLVFYGYGNVWQSGNSGGYLVLGNTVYSLVVVTVCIKSGLEMDSWSWLTHLSLWGSIAFWFVFLVCYSCFWPLGIPFAPNMAGMFSILAKSPIFWLSMLLVPVVTLLPDICYKVYRVAFHASKTDIIRIAEIQNMNVDPFVEDGGSSHSNQGSLAFVLRRLQKLNPKNRRSSGSNTGYAFSQEEDGVVSQSEVVRRYGTANTDRQQRRGGSTRLTDIPWNHKHYLNPNRKVARPVMTKTLPGSVESN
ncbi:probable phospholipid-transporting ATPase IA isoform X3 [Tigriopus californicus]|uniref:probable phospholipid-transporting ATPase IA isoform X3 n=1 Tax=Tigriopus californicus TaxID=6832 RepID=UPI0027D9FDDD|nr:probable phospholipid-transporting ATPase IA isoform X3 [Tigriopus californicus]